MGFGISSDTDFEINRNKFDWFGINFKLLPETLNGNFHQGFLHDLAPLRPLNRS